jgi:hypothetical protein
MVVPFCPPGVAAISADIFFAAGNGSSDGDTTSGPPSWVNSVFWYSDGGTSTRSGTRRRPARRSRYSEHG